jgi:hypothetical protein
MLHIHRGELKKIGLTVGSDGRNRCLLSTFASSTGRNQPSNAKYIFGPATWLRSLIRPQPGLALAYCDWSAQELGIAAYFSGDQAMCEAYVSGDPYLYLARKVGAVPENASKESHPAEREKFKVCSLGVLFGLSAFGLARRLSLTLAGGRELLQMHKETFRRFWKWSDQIEAEAMLLGRLETVFGWQVNVPSGFDPKTKRPVANPRSLRNFPMQAHGAEMMRIACCLTTEAGIRVAAVVHDALLVEAPIDGIEKTAARTVGLMREASEIVLPGFPLKVKADIVRYPDRYSDPRGEDTWKAVGRLLEELQEGESIEDEGGPTVGHLPVPPWDTYRSHRGTPVQ